MMSHGPYDTVAELYSRSTCPSRHWFFKQALFIDMTNKITPMSGLSAICPQLICNEFIFFCVLFPEMSGWKNIFTDYMLFCFFSGMEWLGCGKGSGLVQPYSQSCLDSENGRFTVSGAGKSWSNNVDLTQWYVQYKEKGDKGDTVREGELKHT